MVGVWLVGRCAQLCLSKQHCITLRIFFLQTTHKQMLAEPTISTQIKDLHAYQGGFFRVRVSPEQTGGSFALIEFTLPRGSEPPRHMHTHEDETFYLLDGRVRFEIGDAVIEGEIGQAVFAPRNVAHRFIIQTEQARILTFITPGDFANFFLEFSQPITEVPTSVQAPTGPPPAGLLERLVSRLNDRFDVWLV
jgi:quercetin dioxygenase-like cupin family protein